MRLLEDGRVKSTRNQSSNPNHNYAGLISLIKLFWNSGVYRRLENSKESLNVKLWLISVNFSSQAVDYPPYTPITLHTLLLSLSAACLQLAASMANKGPVSEYQGPVFSSLIGASDHRGADREAGSHSHCTSSHCHKSLPSS